MSLENMTDLELAVKHIEDYNAWFDDVQSKIKDIEASNLTLLSCKPISEKVMRHVYELYEKGIVEDFML